MNSYSQSTLHLSILDLQPRMRPIVDLIAEVAGYLWRNGWAERNGGNITVNVTEMMDDDADKLSPISGPHAIGLTLPFLRGSYFFCKGTGRRMRDLARQPMENGAVIRVLDDGAHYVILADHTVMPTSELPSHLLVHNKLMETGSPYRATLHTHPTEIVALSHNRAMLGKDVLTHLLWSMIPETRAFCPRGLGVVPYYLPGSVALADATLKTLDDYDVVLWEKHGVFAKGMDIMDAFDQIDVLSKSAKIYLDCRAMGFTPEGMSDEQMEELQRAFGL